jgi:hypothetical protein
MEIMKITLSPIASSKTTQLSINGEVLTIDSTDYDLSVIPEGGQVEGELPALGLIKRINEVIEITIEYHYSEDLAISMQSTNALDYIIEVTSGEVQSPIQWRPAEQVEEVVYDKDDPMHSATDEERIGV